MKVSDRILVRRSTIPVRCGSVVIGGNSPISIQTMTKTDTRDVEATLHEIDLLMAAGAEIIRLAIPDETAAEAFGVIRKNTTCPLVADIHFDYKLAVECLRLGADKVRINPGNIGGYNKVLEVAREAKKHGASIRVGINGGSLEKDILTKYQGPIPEALVESAYRCIQFLHDSDFSDIVISLKSSNVPDTIRSYILMAEKTDLPFHIGITEAGPGQQAIIKSSSGIASLICLGLGDTLRVSLTGPSSDEVVVARQILQSLELRSFGPNVISCPTCGRTQVNIVPIAQEVSRRLKDIKAPCTVAVMGCPVNGPGEAKEADYGVACGREGGILFAHGKVIGRVTPEEMVDALLNLIKSENDSRRE
jgi:(E)-4-hydroxy-3-methylbut-2-enyl-diphosphate synthase